MPPSTSVELPAAVKKEATALSIEIVIGKPDVTVVDSIIKLTRTPFTLPTLGVGVEGADVVGVVGVVGVVATVGVVILFLQEEMEPATARQSEKERTVNFFMSFIFSE